MPKPVRALCTAVVSSILLTGCVLSGPFPASPPPGSPSDASARLVRSLPAATPAGTPSVSPSPSLPALLDLETLPELRADGTTTLEVCDPPPGVQLNDPVDALIGCSNGTAAGLRAIEAAVDTPIDRSYVDLPTCTAAPCSSDQLGTAVITAWSGADAWSTSLDARGEHWTLTRPAPTDGSAWPTVAGRLPAGSAPAIDHAPAEIANRKPLPYCGQSEFGAPAEVEPCFLAAVLAGRPAEMFELQHGTEGGDSLLIARFTGSGPIVIYQQHLDDHARTGPWFRQLSGLIIDQNGLGWSMEPIDGTFRDLP